MPSPDATPYVDLRLYDKDAQDVFESALVNLQSYLPDWEPREGQTEVLLMESLGLEVAESVFAINRLPGAIVEVLLGLYGVDRDLGTPPEASVTFTVSDTVGHTIPAGVRVSLSLPDDDPLVFSTTAAVVVPEGATSATVGVVGDRNIDTANGTPAGTPVDLLDGVVFVERAELGSDVTAGAGPEDDDAWFSRGAQRLARLVETLVLPAHFTAAALELTNVTRAFTVDNYDPSSGNAPGADAGHVTVALYGVGGLLSDADKATIQTQFDAQAQANLGVHVIDATVTTVNIAATVQATLGYTADQITASATTALAAYLSPAGWPWSGTVYVNELIALLDGVDGVDRVVSIDTPAADETLPGVAPLAVLGTVTITVEGL